MLITVPPVGRYWYLGAWKHHMTVLRSALTGQWPPVTEAEITYTHECAGCQQCRPLPEWRWWHILIKPNVEGEML